MGTTTQRSFLKNSKSLKAELKEGLAALAQQPSAPFMKQAVALFEFKSIVLPSAFRALSEQTGVSLRTAYHLADIGQHFRHYPNKARLDRIGWTKISIIAANINGDTPRRDIDHWMRFAETHTARECQLHFKGEAFEQETRCMLLRFNDRQYKSLANAVLKHGAKKHSKGLVGVEKALMAILKAHQAEQGNG